MLHIQSFCFSPVQENTYVIYDDEGNCAVIDCGCMSHSEEERLRALLDSKGLQPSMLLCTHLHFDHVWGNAWLKRQFPQLEVYACPIDMEMLPSPNEQIRKFGLMLQCEEFPNEQYHHISAGDTLHLGNYRIEVRHVPGHSPGHVVFYFPEGGFVVSGDTLFYENIGRTDFWYGSYDQLVEAIRTQLLTLPPETVVYPGHDGTTTIAHEREHNPYTR